MENTLFSLMAIDLYDAYFKTFKSRNDMKSLQRAHDCISVSLMFQKIDANEPISYDECTAYLRFICYMTPTDFLSKTMLE